MKSKPFFNADHAIRYLEQSIISVRDKPIFVMRIRTDKRKLVLFYTLPYYAHIVRFSEAEGKEHISHLTITDPHIDMNPVKLGYTNLRTAFDARHKALKTFRAPVRAWKIGLTYNSFRLVPDGKHGQDKSEVFYSKSLYKTMKGEYPSFEQVIARFSKNHSLAFDRLFAIKADGSLHHLYFDEPVGTLYKNAPDLRPEFMFLSQQLDEAMRR